MDMETIYRLYFRDVYLFLQGLTRGKNIIIICGSETPAGVSEPLFFTEGVTQTLPPHKKAPPFGGAGTP